MSNQEQAPYPGFQPYINPQQVPLYPQQQPPAYPQQQPPAYPQQQPPAYPQQQLNQPPAYPQQQGYPQQHGYPQQQGYLPQNPTAYPQNPINYEYASPPPPPPSSSFDGYKVEEGRDATINWSGFSDKAIRQAFIRKVYAILLVQLTFSLGVIALFVFERRVNLFVRRNAYLYYISYIVFLIVYLTLACCSSVRRKWPANLILLSIFTISMSYMLGTISSFHDTKIVIMAVGICASCCLAVSVFSFHTKFDITSCGGVLCILVWVLFIFGLIAIFTYNSILQTIYAACGALLFIVFLAYDTQMIVGGKKHELSPEEHIFAAMTLYIDVVYIFLFLLMLMGSGKK